MPAYAPPETATAAASAAAPTPRAAGYPAAPGDSRPPLQRDVELEAAAVATGAAPGSAPGFTPAHQQGRTPGATVPMAQLEGPAALPALPEVGRKRRRSLLQAAVAGIESPPLAAASGACLTSSSSSSSGGGNSTGRACFAPPRGGGAGLDAREGGTLGLAVGRAHVLQVAGGVLSVHALTAAGARGPLVRAVALRDLFAGVAPGCNAAAARDAAVVHDKRADRFVVAAPCGGFGRVLLAATATPDPAGAWFLFGLVSDAAGTPLACAAPREQALADAPLLGYNADGLFVAHHSYCPSKPRGPGDGATLLALPKWKAYSGSPQMRYAVYTSAEVAAAAAAAAADASGGGGGGAAAGVSPVAAARVRQLRPVLPQAPGDVGEGVAYFVAEVSGEQQLPPPDDDAQGGTCGRSGRGASALSFTISPSCPPSFLPNASQPTLHSTSAAPAAARSRSSRS